MVSDQLSRSLKDLRISVTDRCNFRCTYCMPLDKYEWIDRKEVLTFEEITRIAQVFVRMGVEKIRLTGGEPLLRRDLEKLVSLLVPLGLKDLSLTTNGSLLAEKAAALASAGLKRINVSLDTLDPEKFRRLTRREDLPRIVEGLQVARRAGLKPIKINAVIERGVNDDEILALVEFARTNGFAIRFIEYMDVGNANNWRSEKTVTKQEILKVINEHLPTREVGREGGNAPSVDYEFECGGSVGVIASVSEPFCGSCTRARLTADGKLVTCLFSERGHDLKGLLRSGASDAEMVAAIHAIWAGRGDRYSEERLAAMQSAEGYKAERRKIEMISLGG
jgi:GTP 3',8-cyclase